ncbi:MAG: hypothetical protein OXF49_00145 [Candidatus Saccharibacteria bacterium]|nr:hypothetical protein [Candidatus Saccharibacteria bacterium]
MNYDHSRFYNSIAEYCQMYNVPLENFLEILEDQKVLPMIRGKAMEFIGCAIIQRYLDKSEWSVVKLNLNPQPGTQYDEDVSITHKRTGKRLKAEIKSSVRGSFKLKGRDIAVPFFNVKSHKSRSNKQHAHNDRYLATDFDVLLSNVSNAIFQGNTNKKGLDLIDSKEKIECLKKHYNVNADKDLVRSCYDDWRICLPQDIALMDNTIPRTPPVRLDGGDVWFTPDQLENKLFSLIMP